MPTLEQGGGGAYSIGPSEVRPRANRGVAGGGHCKRDGVPVLKGERTSWAKFVSLLIVVPNT